MTRRQSVWFGTLIVMVMIDIWRLITAVVAAQNGWWAPVFLPILFAVAGAGVNLVRLAGAGMLVEISRGQGWCFTRRLSYGLMLTGMATALVLAISSWPNSL
ncbi:MAG: hypothetical protein ACYC3P_06980 [Bellilinea sp.]